MSRTRERTDGRERVRDERGDGRTRADLALSEAERNVSETAHGTDRRLRFREEFLPDFLDLEFSDGVMPTLSMNLQHDGTGFVVESPGGNAGSPAGSLNGATTSSTSFVTLASYTVSSGSTGRLEEVSASVQSNGEVRVVINGQQFGQVTGGTATSLPFGGASLGEGVNVTVRHRSTNGSSTRTRASITAREV